MRLNTTLTFDQAALAIKTHWPLLEAPAPDRLAGPIGATAQGEGDTLMPPGARRALFEYRTTHGLKDG
jgi:hypothetical protein